LALVAVCAGCITYYNPGGLGGFSGELVLPVDSHADGVGIGVIKRYMKEPSGQSRLWTGYSAALRSVPSANEDMVSLGAGLDLQWAELTALEFGFLLHFGLAVNSAKGDVVFGPLLGIGVQTHLPCGPFPLLVSVNCVHGPFLDYADASFEEPTWVSVEVTLVLSE
jgi:hypothetical protein